jgi:hypothetical protein
MARNANRPDFSGLTTDEIYQMARNAIRELPPDRQSMLMDDLVTALCPTAEEIENLISETLSDENENKRKPR